MALPLSPGVYIMHNKNKKIIYIGKAKALKNRVSQYFGSQQNHSEKVRRMVENVDYFEYIICDSEFEALVLECSLIKQHTPKYNILLKDDKGYSYIRVSDEKWRRITHELQKRDDGALYIGPYMGYYVRKSVEEANKIFMLPTCSRKFPEDFGKARPCLNYHIKQCMAPCTGKVKFSEYNESVEQALEFLKGGSSESIKRLTREMDEASESLEFERAAKIRDKIRAVKRMSDFGSYARERGMSVVFWDNNYIKKGEKGHKLIDRATAKVICPEITKAFTTANKPAGLKSGSSSSTASTTASGKTVSIKAKASVGKTSIKLSWDKVDGAAKYAVYMLKDGKYKCITSKVTANSYTVKSLKSGTKYKFYVRAYVDGKWTKASQSKITTATTKKK